MTYDKKGDKQEDRLDIHKCSHLLSAQLEPEQNSLAKTNHSKRPRYDMVGASAC